MKPLLLLVGFAALTACQTTQSNGKNLRVCNVLEQWIDAKIDRCVAIKEATLNVSDVDQADTARDKQFITQLGSSRGYERFEALERCITDRTGAFDYERQDTPITATGMAAGNYRGVHLRLDWVPEREETILTLMPRKRLK